MHRGGLRQFALLGPGEARPRGQVVAAASNPSSSVNDAADAEAIAEAASRPTMRFVAVKTEEQQGWQARSLFVRQRTQTALRGHLAEFGIVAPQGATNVRKLALLASPELPGASRPTYCNRGLNGKIAEIDNREITKEDEDSRLSMPGVGAASAAFAPGELPGATSRPGSV